MQTISILKREILLDIWCVFTFHLLRSSHPDYPTVGLGSYDLFRSLPTLALFNINLSRSSNPLSTFGNLGRPSVIVLTIPKHPSMGCGSEQYTRWNRVSIQYLLVQHRLSTIVLRWPDRLQLHGNRVQHTKILVATRKAKHTHDAKVTKMRRKVCA
jgi:hypothetical protein